MATIIKGTTANKQKNQRVNKTRSSLSLCALRNVPLCKHILLALLLFSLLDSANICLAAVNNWNCNCSMSQILEMCNSCVMIIQVTITILTESAGREKGASTAGDIFLFARSFIIEFTVFICLWV